MSSNVGLCRAHPRKKYPIHRYFWPSWVFGLGEHFGSPRPQSWLTRLVESSLSSVVMDFDVFDSFRHFDLLTSRLVAFHCTFRPFAVFDFLTFRV